MDGGLGSWHAQAPTKAHLTSQNGKYSTPNATLAMAGEMSGMERVLDDAEQYFGVPKMNEANYYKAKPMNVMGQAIAQINKCFHPAASYFRTGHEGGQSLFERPDREEQESLVEFAKREISYAAKVDESDFRKYLEAQYERMKAAEETKRIKAVMEFSEAMTYLEKQHCTDPGEAKKNVRQLPSKSAKAAWLLELIYIRMKGYGWIEFKVAFHSAKDNTIGTLGDLLKAPFRS